MPDEGQDIHQYIMQKFRSSADESAANRLHLEELGRALGVEIAYAEGKRVVNSFRAHQLLHWAQDSGKQTELQIALFEAYFASGRDISDPAILASLAGDVGLDPAEAAHILEDARFEDAVREEEMLWIGQGVRSVPTFLIGDRYAVSGAREAEELEPLIRNVLTPGCGG